VSSDIEALYKRAKACLWVEDPDTRVWLDAVWLGASPTIQVLVGGGYQNVVAMCQQAFDLGLKHVFGLVDQDFGSTNRQRWSQLQPNERIYRLDVHEFENLLLETTALAGCSLNTRKRVTADLDARLLNSAQSRGWWVSCARFLASTSQSATNGYPPLPGPITSLADAEAHVLGSAWFTTTAAACPTLAAPASVRVELTNAHALTTADLTSGAWRTCFPGKELFREISGYVYQNGAGTTGRHDLIRSIGAWQRKNAVPQQAQDLRTTILARV